jgi:hypothetical protein
MNRSMPISFFAILAISTIACATPVDGSSDDEFAADTAAATANDVRLRGKHKPLSSSAGATPVTVSLFVATTKEPDLFETRERTLKALSPDPNSSALSVTPGTYDIQLHEGEYVVLGYVDRNTFFGPLRFAWIFQTRISIAGNQLHVSGVEGDPFGTQSQSDPITIPATGGPLFAPGTLTGPITYELHGSNTIRVKVPAYAPPFGF